MRARFFLQIRLFLNYAFCHLDEAVELAEEVEVVEDASANQKRKLIKIIFNEHENFLNNNIIITGVVIIGLTPSRCIVDNDQNIYTTLKVIKWKTGQ